MATRKTTSAKANGNGNGAQLRVGPAPQASGDASPCEGPDLGPAEIGGTPGPNVASVVRLPPAHSASGAPSPKRVGLAPKGAAAPPKTGEPPAPGAALPAKRGPGRPPSKPPAPPLERRGVVADPNDPKNKFEFVYDDPTVFKTLFVYYKNLRARDIYVRCDRDGLTFFARDHTKTSRVVARIEGSKVNWYFCAETFWFGLNREQVHPIFASIDASFFKITFRQEHGDTDHINLTLKDAAINKECSYQIMLAHLEPDQELFDAEQVTGAENLVQEFPIEFTLSSKQFKKTVADAANMSEDISVEKHGQKSPLYLTYQRIGASYYETYHSADKICLRADLQPEQMFRCTVTLTNIKSLATSMVAETVQILCRETDYILFRSRLEGDAPVGASKTATKNAAEEAAALIVSTLTNIK